MVMSPAHGWAQWARHKGTPVWSCWSIALLVINAPAVTRRTPYSKVAAHPSALTAGARGWVLGQRRVERAEVGCPQ